MAWLWSILALVGNFTGFSLLKRTPKLKQSFGALEHEWLANAVWDVAQQFVPFMLICNLLLGHQNINKIKNSVPLDAFLTFICLVVPTVIEHLVQYPEFHIDVKDVEQHNSLKRIELFAAFSFASSSFGLSKAYDLTFESGFFTLCLGYAMSVSLEVVDKNGNRYTTFILLTFVFCFLVILLRKYLENNKNKDTTRQRDDQSSDNSNIANQNPNTNDKDDQSPSTSSNANDFHDRHTEPMGRSALHQHNQHPIRIDEDRTLNRHSSMVDIESGQRNTREESWDINEQIWETVPPRLYNDTSSNSGEEDNDGIITRLAEGSSSSDHHVPKIKESEVPDQEIGQEKRDTGSSTSSCHMKLGDSSGFGGYEKDDVPLLAASNGETHIVNTSLCKMDRSKDQSQEGRSQGYEINESPLSPKSSVKVYNDDPDHESFDGDGSNGNGFHGKAGCKLGVNQEDKDPSQECDYQEQENVRPLMEEIPSDSNSGADDIPLCLHKSKKTEVDFGQMKGNVDLRDGINYEGITKPFSDEGTRKPSNSNSFHDEGTKKPSNDDSSDDEGGDDSNSGARCKVGVCWRGRNKCHVTEGKDITNLDNMRLASKDEGSYGQNFNNGTACEVGVGQRGGNKCLVKEGKDIIITHTEISNRSAEGTSDNDDCVGKIEERDVPGQEIGHEEPDTGSSTSSSPIKIAGSTELGGCVPPLLLTKSYNIIDGETQIVKSQMESSKYQSKESDSDRDYQIDDNPILRKSSLKVDKGDDDDKDSYHESSDGDDFHNPTGSKIGVGQRHKDPGQESDCQNQGHIRDDISGDSNLGGDVPLPLSEYMNVEVDLGHIEGSGDTQDEISYEGIRELFSDEGIHKPSDDLKDDSSGDEGNDGDDFSSKAGYKIGLREKNKCPVKKDIDITNLDESCACKPKEEKKQLQAVKFKIMKKAISLSGVDSVAGNWEQQEGTVTGNVGANAVQNNFKKRGRKFGNLPTDRCLLGYGAPPPDKKATPRYVRSLKSTAKVVTKLMSAGGASLGY